MKRFAWYGRLSTKDKQDPTISFPSQRDACAKKVAELGEIVCDFTDQEKGRRDDRDGWSQLVTEAKNRDGRRFDAVVVYATSRLSREMFHALAYERELSRAGVEVYYAVSAGDQTTPEGRLIRHMFQALDQFDVEKLGREVRRAQTENTRQGYRNGGRAPYGYKLKHEPHPDPRRARVGDRKSRLVPDPQQAPVIVEIFDRYLAGSGFNEIVNHLNRPGGPPPPEHVDSRRNTANKWSKVTVKCIIENPIYTGQLYWNRLDFRQAKLGEGPVIRRAPEDWITSDITHEPLVSRERFEQAQAEMTKRRHTEGVRRRSAQKRFYELRGVVQCATGHNPLRMHGKERKGITYYACNYRISYGDKAAEALGHGKWQYIREDELMSQIDRFFDFHIFGPNRFTHFRAQQNDLLTARDSETERRRQGLTKDLADIDHRIQRQLAAIEAGVDPALVAQRIQELRTEQEITQALLTGIKAQTPDRIDLDQAREILDALPDLRGALKAADPQLRRQVYDAFHFTVDVDRNAHTLVMRATVSSAVAAAGGDDLEALVANAEVAGAGFEPATFGL